ncbi:hypothetical protein NSK_003371 [Nannochloropsis salina CCMP1776]|jgi:uncharacterized membrane protein YjjB (DUF3815 family)|uniref:Bulb-type lectin domain-containing protein n=1 Tax=Nannochloropsis salina CCMP1776 TaxID=1027361 RepID=A0A4D9D1I7_9STRA|nr:hypothetical protein NSK_003371 [Nannochloropsis salina CCMP1776]|eukprot:TFJ85412.1 hypothetical protein NSK_003371 [Nannochloropsis salina CCMP1776]
MTVGSTTLTSAGDSDIFIISLDSSGSPVWAMSFGGTSGDIGYAIAVDALGSSYTTGRFQGNMTVGSTTLTSAGDSDIFIIKLDSSGSPVWAMSFGGTSGDIGYAIAVDASGSSYTTGEFQGSMTVGSTTLTSAGGADIYIIKLDSSGSPVWAMSFGGTDFDIGNAIAVDASGSSYTTGRFQGSMTVGSTTLTSAGAADIFIINLDSSGSPVWAMSFGGTKDDIGNAIAVDASGSSYTTGYFQGNMTVGSTTLTSAGAADIFIINLDSSGSPVWAMSFGGTSGDFGFAIAVDASGSSYTTGYFQKSMTVGSTTLTSAGGADIFIINLDSSGSPVWATSVGGTDNDIGYAIALNALGSSYTTGYFKGNMTVDNTTLTSAGDADIFIYKTGI